MNVYRMGLIGLGIIGQRMLANTPRHPGFQAVCAWDPDPRAMQVTGELYPDLRLVDSAEAVIQDAGLDLIYVACPPRFHAAYAAAAADQGKAVLCEKPLAIDLDEARALVRQVEQRRTVNAVNFVFGSAPASQQLAGHLKAGEAGTVLHVDLRLHFRRWPRDWQAAADWLRFRDQGGFTREVSSHFVYLAERLFGPARLTHVARGWQDDPALCERHLMAVLDFDGVPMSLTSSAGGAGEDVVEFTVRGSERSFRLWNWFLLQSNDGEGWQNQMDPSQDLRTAAVQAQLDNLHRQLSGERHSMPGFADALRVQELIEAMLAA